MADKKEQSKTEQDKVLATAEQAKSLLGNEYFVSLLKRVEDGANATLCTLQPHNTEEFKTLTQSKAFLLVIRGEIGKDVRAGKILEEKIAGTTKKSRIS